MKFFHVVLLHPKSTIQRPAPKSFDSTNVIKADQFPPWHQRFVDKEGTFGETLKLMANLRGLDTIQDWAKKLVRQHRPADLLELPDFMQPRPISVASAVGAHEAQQDESLPAPRQPKIAALPSVVDLDQMVATEPLCPRCGKVMVQRVAKRGAAPGKSFWGCTAYSSGCRGTREVQGMNTPR